MGKKLNDELQQLAGEAAEADQTIIPPGEADAAADQAKPVNDDPAAGQVNNGLKQPDAGMVALGCMIVEALGQVVTARAAVAPLTSAEVESLGKSVALVAAQYDLDNMPPRAAAWIGLGVATLGVAFPRLPGRGGGPL